MSKVAVADAVGEPVPFAITSEVYPPTLTGTHEATFALSSVLPDGHAIGGVAATLLTVTLGATVIVADAVAVQPLASVPTAV